VVHDVAGMFTSQPASPALKLLGLVAEAPPTPLVCHSSGSMMGAILNEAREA